MTENQYKIKVVLDDSQIKELEQKLSGLTGIGSSSGKATGGLFGSAFMKNIGQLAKIAVGVGALVVFGKKMLDLAIKSSPIAQSSFKLLQTSINFILRPIGDVIGFVVRPFALMMLKWAIPFYKNWANSTSFQKLAKGDVLGAIMDALNLTPENTENSPTNWGEALKQAEAKLFTDWQGFVNELGLEIATLGATIQDAFGKIGAKFIPIIEYVGGIGKTIMSKVRTFFVDVAKSLKLEELTKMWLSVTKWFTTIKDTTLNILDGGLKAFVGFFGNITSSISDQLFGYWKTVTDFFLQLSTSISTTISSAWSQLTKFIDELVKFFMTLPQRIWDAIVGGIGNSIFGGGNKSGNTTVNSNNKTIINNNQTAPRGYDPTAEMFPWLKK